METQKSQKITLIQPRYPYGGRQIYLPGSLLNLGSRLMEVGYQVDLIDLNIAYLEDPFVREHLRQADLIGITVLGTPYIPEVLELIYELQSIGGTQTILIGGEGIMRLTPEQASQIFSQDKVQVIQSDQDLNGLLGQVLLSKFDVSMVPMLETLEPRQRLDYLHREFCLFLSHGCAFNCHFCAAAKGEPEAYRQTKHILTEVGYISELLSQAGFHELNVYLSNLDALQRPKKLEEVLEKAHKVAQAYNIELRVRALATTHFTALALRKDPQILKRLSALGLYMLGFGADGISESVWARQNKRHNRVSDLEICLQACKEASIEPEALMIMGLPEERFKETWEMLTWCLKKAYHDKIAIRMYVGKDGAPGSKTWEEDEYLRAMFLHDPALFHFLDYTMPASEVTHPNKAQRWRINLSYFSLLAALIPTRYVTPPLLPVPRNPLLGPFVRLLNSLLPLDR